MFKSLFSDGSIFEHGDASYSTAFKRFKSYCNEFNVIGAFYCGKTLIRESGCPVGYEGSRKNIYRFREHYGVSPDLHLSSLI